MLQEKRKAKGLTQKQLAKEINVHYRIIQLYEENQTNINIAKLSRLLDICKVLGCKITDILTDEELIKRCKGVEM